MWTEIFDSIIVITDRLILNQQIQDEIKGYCAGERYRGPCRELW
jgi:type I site-specific restriction-modification system R (restriction) subunit